MARFKDVCSRLEIFDTGTGEWIHEFVQQSIAFTPEEEAAADAEEAGANSVDAQIARLDADFTAKKLALATRKATIDLADGADYATKLAAIQTEYQTLVADYSAAYDAILFG